MYSKSDQDFNKLFEVLKYHRENTHIQKRWLSIAEELNKFFHTSLSAKQWKDQHNSGVKRLKKYGTAGIKLSRTVEKEIANLNVSPKIMEDDIETKKKMLKTYLIKSKTIEQIEKHIGVNHIQALGIIQSLKFDGYSVMYLENEREYVIDRKPLVNNQTYNHSIGETLEFEFVVIGDSHWGQRGQQKSFVNYIYELANKRGIKNVYHVGDISDGFYKNRPEHIYELFLLGADEQVNYIVNNWPHYDGITTHFIIGNHDETHIMNGGCNIGVAIVKGRKALGYEDFEYLGIGYAPIQLTPNCRMDLFHPLDGSAYAISYSGQKYMDSLSGGDKPNIIFTGHHHKAMYFPYRNIHYFEVPSMTRQSSWMKRKRIANESGAWFIKLKVDEEGTLVSVISEHIKQYKFLENDF